MKQSTSSSGRRAPNKTSLTISLPKELKKAIENAAANDDRTVSNYLVRELSRIYGVTMEQTRRQREKEG